MRKKIPYILGTSFLSLALMADTYTVQEDDTLSQIAYRFISQKVYGENGSLRKIVKLNPQIKNPNIILIGDQIRLSEKAIQTDVITNENNQKIEVISAKEKSSSLKFSPFLSYSKISVEKNNSRLDLSSDLSLGIEFDWKVDLNEKLSLSLFASYVKYSFEAPENRVLKNNKASQNHFGLKTHYQFSHDFSLNGSLGYGQFLFLRTDTVNSLVIEKLQTTFISLEPEWKFYRVSNIEIGLHSPLSYNFSSSNSDISTEGGLGYGLGLKLSQKLKWGELEGGILYQNRMNSYSGFDTSFTDLKFGFGVRFNI